MSDVLISDVPDDVLAILDSRAANLGLSRNEYLRRRLSQDAGRAEGSVTVEDLRRFSRRFGDLADPDTLGPAWS